MIIKLNALFFKRLSKLFRVYLWSVILPLSFAACQKDGTISLDNTNDEIGVELSDSTTVTASTYQLDKVPSSGKGVILVGQIEDNETGNLKVSSYFRIGNTGISGLSLPDDATFDSLSFAIPYQGYYYGDTTITQQVSLHRLTEPLELIDPSSAWEDDEQPVFVSGSALYTNNSFAYDASPLGTVSFRPKPKSKTDTVFIRMSDTFGQDLWQKIKNKDQQVTNLDNFLDYLKGLVLVPQGKAGVVTGFKTDSVSMDLYYRYTRDTDGKSIQNVIKLSVNDSTFQFNGVQVDRKSSTLKDLPSAGKAELAAAQTGQKVMLQGLTGLVTKIRFPYLYDFVNREDIIINKAVLTIETTAASHIPYAAPTALNMLLADQYGIPKSLLNYSWQTYAQAPTLQESADGGAQNGQYSFDLTEYVSKYRKAVRDDKSALYLSLPVADLLSKVDRLVVAPGDNAPLIRLRLWYTRY